MKRMVTRAVVLASVVGGSIVAAAPASANVLRNYGSEFPGSAQPLCIGPRAGAISNGTDIVTWTCDNVPNQNWDQESFDPGYVQLWNGASPAYNRTTDDFSECLALFNNGSTNAGNKLIIWDCYSASPDQGWRLSRVALSDNNGMPCYNLLNEKADEQGNLMAVSLNSHYAKSENVVIEPFNARDSSQIWCLYPDNQNH